MLATAINDEPSMESILAEVRRILTEEDAGHSPQPALREGDKPLVLTNMIAADGSVVSIAPSTKAYAALRPMARRPDPFAGIDELRHRVSELVTSELETAGAGHGPRPRLPSRRAATEAMTVDVAMLCQTPIIVPGYAPDHAGVDIVRTRTRAPARIEMAETPIAPTVAAGPDTTPCAGRARDPVAEIERMLAHQMAAAHHAAVTLTGAAVDQIQTGAGGDDDLNRPLSRARGGVRVLGKRRRGDDAARLAETATRMMEAYNNALDTLMALRGDAAKSIAAHKPGGRKRGRPGKGARSIATRSAKRGKGRRAPRRLSARAK